MCRTASRTARARSWRPADGRPGSNWSTATASSRDRGPRAARPPPPGPDDWGRFAWESAHAGQSRARRAGAPVVRRPSRFALWIGDPAGGGGRHRDRGRERSRGATPAPARRLAADARRVRADGDLWVSSPGSTRSSACHRRRGAGRIARATLLIPGGRPGRPATPPAGAARFAVDHRGSSGRPFGRQCRRPHRPRPGRGRLLPGRADLPAPGLRARTCAVPFSAAPAARRPPRQPLQLGRRDGADGNALVWFTEAAPTARAAARGARRPEIGQTHFTCGCPPRSACARRRGRGLVHRGVDNRIGKLTPDVTDAGSADAATRCGLQHPERRPVEEPELTHRGPCDLRPAQRRGRRPRGGSGSRRRDRQAGLLDPGSAVAGRRPGCRSSSFRDTPFGAAASRRISPWTAPAGCSGPTSTATPSASSTPAGTGGLAHAAAPAPGGPPQPDRLAASSTPRATSACRDGRERAHPRSAASAPASPAPPRRARGRPRPRRPPARPWPGLRPFRGRRQTDAGRGIVARAPAASAAGGRLTVTGRRWEGRGRPLRRGDVVGRLADGGRRGAAGRRAAGARGPRRPGRSRAGARARAASRRHGVELRRPLRAPVSAADGRPGPRPGAAPGGAARRRRGALAGRPPCRTGGPGAAEPPATRAAARPAGAVAPPAHARARRRRPATGRSSPRPGEPSTCAVVPGAGRLPAGRRFDIPLLGGSGPARTPLPRRARRAQRPGGGAARVRRRRRAHAVRGRVTRSP